MTGARPPTRRIALLPGSIDGGGIGMVMLALAMGVCDRGLAVDLLLTGDPPQRRIPAGVRVVPLGPRTRSALLPLRRYLREAQPDLLISARDHINLLALAAHRLSGLGARCPLVWSYHTHRSAQHSAMTRAERLADALALRLIRIPDARVAVSVGVAEDMVRATGLPLAAFRVIPNPAWSSRQAVAAQAPCAHAWLADRRPGDRNPAAPVILGLGRFVPQKDFPTLITAFAGLRASAPGARLILAGEGPDRAALLDLVAALGLGAAVDLPGQIDNPLPLLARADLFVLSSRWEGFSLALVEALGCGCPVVATDCPTGPAMILQDGRLGPLVRPGDAQAMARAMAGVLTNPPDPAPLRARAADFDPGSAVSAYLDLLR